MGIKIKKVVIIFFILIGIFFIVPAYAYSNQLTYVNGTSTIIVTSPTPSTAYTYLYYTVNQYWKQGNTYYYDISFSIKNTSTHAVAYDWNVAFDLPSNAAVVSVTNAAYTRSGIKMTLWDASNRGILPREMHTFRVVYSSSTAGALPNNAWVNDVHVDLTVFEGEDDTSLYLDLTAIPTVTKVNGNYKYDLTIAITNNNDQAVNGWEVILAVPPDTEVKSYQNANYVNKIPSVNLSNLTSNGTLNPNQTIYVYVTIGTATANYVPVVTKALGSPVN